ncbi:MAG: SDR family NAD(P)-dependent oxidoreductase [Hyphomonadaceae bacterium]
MTYKPFDLTGRVALVTGGNGGIGLGMADALAQAGASVEIWGTNAEKNARALEQLKAHGTKVNARIVDVSTEENVVAGFNATLAEFGRVDSCFANAGVSNRWKSFLDIGGEDYRRVMAINLDGMIWTMREACRHMKARGAGRCRRLDRCGREPRRALRRRAQSGLHGHESRHHLRHQRHRC